MESLEPSVTEQAEKFTNLDDVLSNVGVSFTDAFRLPGPKLCSYSLHTWSTVDQDLLNQQDIRWVPSNDTTRVVEVNPPTRMPGSVYTVPKISNFERNSTQGAKNSITVRASCSQNPITSNMQGQGPWCFNYDHDAWENLNLVLAHVYDHATEIDECLYTRVADGLKQYIELVCPIRISFDAAIRDNHVALLRMKNVDQVKSLLGL